MAHSMLYTLGYNAEADRILPDDFDWSDTASLDAAYRQVADALRPWTLDFHVAQNDGTVFGSGDHERTGRHCRVDDPNGSERRAPAANRPRCARCRAGPAPGRPARRGRLFDLVRSRRPISGPWRLCRLRRRSTHRSVIVRHNPGARQAVVLVEHRLRNPTEEHEGVDMTVDAGAAGAGGAGREPHAEGWRCGRGREGRRRRHRGGATGPVGDAGRGTAAGASRPSAGYSSRWRSAALPWRSTPASTIGSGTGGDFCEL
jgi:hypothetical protein